MTAQLPEGYDPSDYVTIWEDAVFQITVSVNTKLSPPVKQLKILDKETGSQIFFNAADGDSENAGTIAIEAETQLQLYSKTMIDITSPMVRVNGRVISMGEAGI
jgi:hypothetical protein